MTHHDVESDDTIPSRRDGEWRDIFARAGHTLTDGQPADTNELVKDAPAAQENAISDDDMAPEEDIVGDDNAVADPNVMPKMRSGH
jgi:hypothetical protein